MILQVEEICGQCGMMVMRTIEVLNKHKSAEPSKWREEAECRRRNSRWLKYSSMVALMVRQRMQEVGVTQVMLADRLGCTQQHVSTLLKGSSNLTLGTIAKLEEALDFNIIGDAIIPVNGYKQENVVVRRSYLSDSEIAPYAEGKDA